MNNANRAFEAWATDTRTKLQCREAEVRALRAQSDAALAAYNAQAASFTSTVGSPFEQLSMIPMLTIIAVNAPAGRRATWFALMASLMNLALNAASLGTKWLNKVFPMDNDGPFDAVGPLMITTTTIGLVVPLVVIALVGRKLRASTNPTAPIPEGEPT